ncbi:hypothetical protein PoB_002032900 [Plakobranchus ocellatus]|uniref:Uncharacterized protein n=1 Tax=Plakobranchus ocellatus TaxID=259542 RepID=A0AAV3ZEL4_9GAST|nr:hypothetical protein PoB_002032900 [Plakobranchus ocellatus]
MVSSAVYAVGISRAVTFDMTTLATSNTYNSRFFTAVLAVAIALALIAAYSNVFCLAASGCQSSVMRSQLPSLVTSMVSSPRIDFNSLWILKGDLSATIADDFELITINLSNGDEGDTFIKAGRSSAFL